MHVIVTAWYSYAGLVRAVLTDVVVTTQYGYAKSIVGIFRQ